MALPDPLEPCDEVLDLGLASFARARAVSQLTGLPVRFVAEWGTSWESEVMKVRDPAVLRHIAEGSPVIMTFDRWK